MNNGQKKEEEHVIPFENENEVENGKSSVRKVNGKIIIHNDLFKDNNNTESNLKSENTITKNNSNSNCKNKKKLWIILGILVPIIIAVVIFIYIIINRPPKPENSKEESSDFSVIIPVYEKNNTKLESEFEFNNKVGDLRRIFVNQKYEENRLYEGKEIKAIKERITNYDIFIMSELEPEPGFVNYYNKIYTVAISIVNECFGSENEDCTPQAMVDLTSSDIHNKRNLQEVNDLKDIPIPICLFNLTNNDVITSITCPESFPENKKNLMVLDLYFFRPPGLKRPNKEEMNNTINLEKRGENIFIRETNGGICDIENSIGSFCTTEMNTTTDKEGNILNYEEVAYMEIETDENNSYTKKKITNLVDKTNEIKSLKPDKYNSTLNQLLPKLKSYFKYNELFSKEDFEEILLISKNSSKEKKLKKRRNLREEVIPTASLENNILNFDGNSGVKIEFGLINNAGIGNEFMEAKTKLKIEDNNKEISSSRKSSLNINRIITDLSILSEAGNKKANQLIKNTNTSLEDMTEDINNDISYLNSLVKYKDLLDIFDATISLDTENILPFSIIQESSNLKTNLEELLNSIENGGIKKDVKILNKNIYDFTSELHKIINQLFDNLSDLTNSLKSEKSKLTEISTYYLKNTSISYLSAVEKAENILINYYKDEYKMIRSEVDNILEIFENKIMQSLQRQLNIIENTYENINNGNYTIDPANEEDLKAIKNNLYYAKNYLISLINKIKEKVIKEMDIKDNGYLMTNYDINSNNERSDVITNGKLIAAKLDNDTLIDTLFDKLMTQFRKNYTNIIKFMDKEKEEKFPLNENVLKEEHFSSEVQNKIQNDINKLGVDISNNIRKENDYYLEEKNKVIENFIKNEKKNLDDLAFEIDSLFTEKNLGEIVNLYEKTYRSYLDKIYIELENNNKSTFSYFSNLLSIMEDNSQTLDLLRKYKADDATLLKYNPYKIKNKKCKHCLGSWFFEDTISTKYKTNGYLNKYLIFMEFLEYSKDFINNQIYGELLTDYKNAMFKLREILQNFKNNKLKDKYPDTSEFLFIENHMNIIDNLYNRLNNQFSDNIFNSKFNPIFNEFKQKANNKLNEINKFISSKHEIINSYSLYSEINYDFCLTFKRKISYTCKNGAVSIHTESDDYCFPVVTNEHKKLIKHKITTSDEYLKFKTQFNNFYTNVKNKVDAYTTKINDLKSSLLKAEKSAINQNYTLNYLSAINNTINSLLILKYGEELVRKSYNYYKTNINDLLEPLLNSISEKWYEAFDLIIKEIKDNLDKFKYSVSEFHYIGVIYATLIRKNITINYFNVIEAHQRNEFNYTISYYYNILLKLVKSTKQYTINKIPNNRVGYNNVLDTRKKEINYMFDYLIDLIEQSEAKALNEREQCNILQVSKTNFFNINDVLSKNILETEKILQQKISELYQINSPYSNDDVALTAKYYLENQISKLQIEELYEEINRKVFIVLNLDKFKEILIENWIFDQDEFINEFNNTLYNSNLQIDKELSTQKENYRKELEKYITKDFTKETLINKISDLYNSEIKSLEAEQVDTINQYVQEILDKIKLYIAEESNILLSTLNSYNNNFTKINNRINSYKSVIFQKLNGTIFSILEAFYQNLINNLHNQYVIAHLDQCSSISKRFTETYRDFILLNTSYKTGEIIDNMINNIAVDIKNISKNQIDYIYQKIYQKIKDNVKLDELQKLINEQIEQEYNTVLLPSLQTIATNEAGIVGYTEYDFSNTILGDINSFIETNMNKIQNIMNSTKGSNFNVNINSWERDCTRIDEKVDEIYNKFLIFITEEKSNEEDEINEYLQKIIKSNFNNLINNIIQTFGNNFFERIIKYNENFKIVSLYDSLIYSLSETITYYLFLKNPTIFNALTKDLKLKLYSFNDLDSIVQEKNNEVLQILEEEINKFINDSKEYLINKYKSYFTSDLSIELSFNDEINRKIKSIFNLAQVELETDYINLLNKYFKEQLIESYSKIINLKTKEMINTIKDERESFKRQIDDYFTIDVDNVLNDINLKLNNTLNSIEEYKNQFNTFKISDDLIKFLNNYGENSVKSIYDQFIGAINEASKYKIVSTVLINSKYYINYYNFEIFKNQTDNIYSNIKEQYIEHINASIMTYGIDEYPNNLEKEINEIENLKKRRSLRGLNEEEIINLFKNKIADKSIDDTFSRLLASSYNAKTFINSFNYFDEFDREIEDNINKLNSAYKSGLNIIKRNNYEEDIQNALMNKLAELKNFTLEYYNNITENFNKIRNYLHDAINEIYNNLNRCANITYSTFAEKYINISNEVKAFNDEDIKTESETKDSVSVSNQNKIIDVNYTVSDMVKNVKFLFELVFEGEELKKPRVKVSIINQSKPSKISFGIIEPQYGCGKIVELVEASFKDVNFSLSINFFTNSTNLYMNIFGDFRGYYITKELYEIEEKIDYFCYEVMGTSFCSERRQCNDNEHKILTPKANILVDRKLINDDIIIPFDY